MFSRSIYLYASLTSKIYLIRTLLQSKLRALQLYSQTDNYCLAYTKLNLDPNNPIVSTSKNNIRLKSQQITGLNYLLNDIPKPLRRYLLSNNYRLSKTFLVLELEAYQKQKKLIKSKRGKAANFRLLIIFYLANIISVQIKEYEKYYYSCFKLLY